MMNTTEKDLISEEVLNKNNSADSVGIGESGMSENSEQPENNINESTKTEEFCEVEPAVKYEEFNAPADNNSRLNQLITEIESLKQQLQNLQQFYLTLDQRLKTLERSTQITDEEPPSEDEKKTDGKADSEIKDEKNIGDRVLRLIKDLLRIIHSTSSYYGREIVSQETSFKDLLEHFRLMQSVLEQYLKECGLKLIIPKEKMDFDPVYHVCTDLVSTENEEEHGTIHSCTTLGIYNFKTDVVLTPAEVSVMKYKSEE